MKKKLPRIEFLLQALESAGRIDREEKVIYFPFDFQFSPVNIHDLEELKREHKYIVQYEIPCETKFNKN